MTRNEFASRHGPVFQGDGFYIGVSPGLHCFRTEYQRGRVVDWDDRRLGLTLEDQLLDHQRFRHRGFILKALCQALRAFFRAIEEISPP